MLDVPLNFLGCLGVQNEANGEFIAFPHRVGDNVTFFKFVDESFSSGIEKETTNSTKSFGSKEFDFSVGIFGIHETSGMDLDFVHVDSFSTNCHNLMLVV